MKLALVCAVLGLALAPPAAIAKKGKLTYAGAVTLEPASELRLKMIKKGGGKRNVKNLVFDGIPAACSGGRIETIGGSLSDSARVRKRKFKLEGSGPLQSLTLKGKVTRRGKRLSGTLSFSGTFEVDGQPLTCNTGPRSWSAKAT